MLALRDGAGQNRCAAVAVVDQRSYRYLLLNPFGWAVLPFIAVNGRQWGFMFLGGGWALVSFWAIGGRVQGRHSVSAS